MVFVFYQRRERDSNPRTLAGQRFSRPPRSTTLPSLRGKDNIILENYFLFLFPFLLLAQKKREKEKGATNTNRKDLTLSSIHFRHFASIAVRAVRGQAAHRQVEIKV